MKASALSQASIYQDERYEIIDMSEIMAKKCPGGMPSVNALRMSICQCRTSRSHGSARTAMTRSKRLRQGTFQTGLSSGKRLVHNANFSP